MSRPVLDALSVSVELASRPVVLTDFDANSDCFCGDVGINLDVIDIDGVGRDKSDFADDAVPVGLRMVANLVSVADGRIFRVIDSQGQLMAARRQRAKCINVRSHERILRTETIAVNPKPAVFCAFEKKRNTFV